MAEAVLAHREGSEKGAEYRAIGLVSAAHFVNHFQHLVLPLYVLLGNVAPLSVNAVVRQVASDDPR